MTGIAATSTGLLFFQNDRDQPVFFAHLGPIGINRVGQLDGMTEEGRGPPRPSLPGLLDCLMGGQRSAEDQARARYADLQVIEINPRKHRIDDQGLRTCPQGDARVLPFTGPVL